ncbi:MAG: sensor hybrid histidine kinase [Acidobacteriales bacterium]|nr:sensor hybrid histidine kinase [Terriglobales bacterium]
MFLGHRLSDWYVEYPVGKIAFPTAFSFLFAGIALLTFKDSRIPWISDACAAVILSVCYLSLTGYAYNIARFYGRVMALPTTLLLLFAALAIFSARQRGGIEATVVGDHAGSVVLRRVLPPVVLLLPILGVLRSRAETLGWSDAMATAVFVLASVALFTGIILQTSSILNKVDAARKKKQQELQDFFENAVVGLHWVGPDGTILWANAAELALLGYSADEYIGKNITEFHADADTICDILNRLSAGETLRSYSARLKCKDGSIKHVAIHSSVLFDEDEFVHTRCFTFDVSAEVEAKNKLELREKMLRESEKLAVTGKLAASLAHEINNPLEAVTNLLYLASQDADISPASRNFLELADKELQRMAHVAKHTLAFHKGSTSETEFSLVDLSDQILSVLSSRINAKEIQVCRNYQADSKVSAIETEARQVISNLLLNALDAAPIGSAVKVHIIESSPGLVNFAVEDMGAGISKEVEEKIFEPFFTTQPTGTGLGLWVSQEIMRRNGGALKLEHNQNPTRFNAYFKESSRLTTVVSA